MNVIVICEFSGIVRQAFQAQGHNAWSIDLLESEQPGNHIQADILTIDYNFWKQFDLAICHPPCTHLAVSGARWFKDKKLEQLQALKFVEFLINLPIKKIAIENPISIISTKIRKPDQIVQPYEFGHGETKATCFWLKNLPLLQATNVVPGREARIHNMSPGINRWRERSRTYPGIAQAMAEQWS